MSQNQLVQARVNGEVKAQATAALAVMGLTLSDAVRILLTSVAQKKMMPLELLTQNKATLTAMEDARMGKVKTATLDEIRAVIRANN